MESDQTVVEVRYHESIKDQSGAIRTYEAKITRSFSVAGLQPEQQVAKMNAVHDFIHDEIHQSIIDQQIRDGLRTPGETHVNAPE